MTKVIATSVVQLAVAAGPPHAAGMAQPTMADEIVPETRRGSRASMPVPGLALVPIGMGMADNGNKPAQGRAHQTTLRPPVGVAVPQRVRLVDDSLRISREPDRRDGRFAP